MVKMLDITLLDTYPSNTKDQRNQLARSHGPNRHPNIASGHVDLEKWGVSQILWEPKVPKDAKNAVDGGPLHEKVVKHTPEN